MSEITPYRRPRASREGRDRRHRVLPHPQPRRRVPRAHLRREPQVQDEVPAADSSSLVEKDDGRLLQNRGRRLRLQAVHTRQGLHLEARIKDGHVMDDMTADEVNGKFRRRAGAYRAACRTTSDRTAKTARCGEGYLARGFALIPYGRRHPGSSAAALWGCAWPCMRASRLSARFHKLAAPSGSPSHDEGRSLGAARLLQLPPRWISLSPTSGPVALTETGDP